MKTKLSTQAKPPTPAICSQDKSTGEIPAVLKRLEGKTPCEMLQTINPEIKIEAMAGMICGLGLETEMPIPEWAKKASKQFWKYYFRKDFDPANCIEDGGTFFGLLEKISQELDESPPKKPMPGFMAFAKAVGSFALKHLENEARTQSPDDTAKFYIGRARATKVILKMKDADYLKMQKRAPIYLCIAIRWRQFESFKSQAEAERWLRAQKVIGECVDSGEVRAVLRVVGLRYCGPGRPKKLKQDASNSTKPDSGK